MKIKFGTFDKVNQFIRLAQSVNADVFVKYGKYVVDGCSVMGVYSLDLSKEFELDVIEKADGEYDRLIAKLRELDIVTE